MEQNTAKSSINWYPGHMTKAKRAMLEDIKLIDLVIELVDARIPMSSRNPDIDRMAAGKARLILLNKSDLADGAKNAEWVKYFTEKGAHVLKIDSRNKADMKAVSAVIAEACKEKKERDRKRGIINRPVRAMVAGIPNVGKSTFINSFAGRVCAKTGNKPGVTKGKQWIRLNKDVELLDTPGILWPKFDDAAVGIHLAFIGSVNDNIIDLTQLAAELAEFLNREYPKALSERYGEAAVGDKAGLLGAIAKARGCLKKGGELDYDKAAVMLLEDFRSGKLGRITIEAPEDYEKEANVCD
ncbi:MAG: ribosome biogenesis GTPase YlqF [Butyrivibrio sp.]|nr:ribosome biogenesis GTPase YlqF [Butyrivibrio sp.]